MRKHLVALVALACIAAIGTIPLSGALIGLPSGTPQARTDTAQSEAVDFDKTVEEAKELLLPDCSRSDPKNEPKPLCVGREAYPWGCNTGPLRYGLDGRLPYEKVKGGCVLYDW